ncbi:SOS response-associated peptidase [Rhodocytophaga rosea]|uniref:Abasic site processing protein n=1 Tax=Rhodocytophaga rosea TaxID=2704465 RepID=A0A6C0GF49_9BACT|nr:SOS response-associated peptidase [Rhodocytophaga rosea]QHT66615.1 SOS response-associated peptidase [Rhodocytophaga rosea]
MCDRYSFALTKQKITRRFQVKVTQAPDINYNISPGNTVPVILSQPERHLDFFRWGLENQLAVNKKKAKLIHAIDTKMLVKQNRLQQITQNQRCLIPADGFYIWYKISRRSQVPYRVVLKWNMPFAFAGIWELYADTESQPSLRACSLFTTEANELLKKLQSTMPVILPLELENEWLNPEVSLHEAMQMLQTFPADKMNCFPVSAQINNPAFNSPELLQAVQATDQFGNYILFQE